MIFSFVLFVLLVAGVSCRKESLNYRMAGTVSNARSGTVLADVSLQLTQQQIVDGSFNGQYLFAASDATDAGGSYSLEWLRENVIEFRMEVIREGFIGHTYTIPTDLFSTESTYTRNFSLYPEAFIEVHVLSTLPSTGSEEFSFRFDDADFDCACCNDTWRNFSGFPMDSTFSCKLYGDQYLKYITHVVTETVDTLIPDSVWCPAFVTTHLALEY